MGEVVALQRLAGASNGGSRLDLYVRLPNRPTLRLPLITRTRNGACFAGEAPLPRYFIGRVSGERVERMYELVWQQNGLIGARAVTASTMRKRTSAAPRHAPPFAAAMT